MTPFWINTSGPKLAQGDMLTACVLPVFQGDQKGAGPGFARNTPVAQADLIVVTQSCDLEQAKVDFVALCPIHTLTAFEETNPEFKARGRWENVRKGRVDGLHLLASPTTPADNHAALVVDFGLIVSLPFEYLSAYAASLNDRWRLQSPFLEHFSQAFARFFMRVGLPSSIPAFK